MRIWNYSSFKVVYRNTVRRWNLFVINITQYIIECGKELTCSYTNPPVKLFLRYHKVVYVKV